MIELNRHKIFIIGLSLLLIGIFAPKLYVVSNGERTIGTVVEIRELRSHKGHSFAPIISFNTNNLTYRFKGENYLDYQVGDKVEVIYSKSEDYDPHIFSLGDFWMPNVFYSLLPLILLFSIVYSFLTKRDLIIISYSPPLNFRINKLKKQKKQKMSDSKILHEN